MIFELETDYIELFKLLKAAAVVASGGEAKHAIDEGEVEVNGVVETRRRYKVRPGDRIRIGDIEILAATASEPEQ